MLGHSPGICPRSLLTLIGRHESVDEPGEHAQRWNESNDFHYSPEGEE